MQYTGGLMKVIAFLLFCVVSANCQVPTAKVTFFREDQSMLKQMGQFKIDYAPAGAKWNIYMDGVRLVTLHRNRMITFTIPAGHHDFKTDNTAMVPVDVQPGSSIFLRPGMDRSKNKLEGVYNFRVVTCADYLDRTKQIKSVDARDIFTGNVMHEPSFASLCPSK